MTIASYRILDGKKFLWDGKEYPAAAEAEAAAKEYAGNRFETQQLEEGGVYLVYTRRKASADG